MQQYSSTTTDDQPTTSAGSGWSGRCASCGKPAVKGIIIGVETCLDCFEQATHEAVRLYRKSLRVVQGGYPL